VATLMFVGTATCVLGQTRQAKIPIAVFSTSKDDNLGSRLVFELKEAIRSSQRFALIDGKPFGRRPKRFKEDSLAYLALYIVTLAPDENRSIYGVTFAYDSLDMALGGGLVDHVVGSCGKRVLAECARDLLSDIDRAADKVRDSAPVFYENLLSD
jgi:hypothetical protein